MDDQFDDLKVEPPLELDRSGQGRLLRISKTHIPYAKLTGISGTAYEWIEQDYDEDGVPFDTDPEVTGEDGDFPAYELSNSTSVAVDGSVIVPLWLGPTGLFYLFSASDGGSSGIGRKLRATLTGTLTYTGNTTATVVGGGSITVYDWLLSSGQTIASGIKITVFLDADGKYYVDGAQCP